MKVKEIDGDVGTGQEIAGREGIALESCISEVLLIRILYGLGTKLQFRTWIWHHSCLLLSCFWGVVLKYL